MDQQTAFEAVTKMMAGCAEFFWDSFVALQVNGITGDYAEFGCHTGGSFQAAYHSIAKITPERHMWAFDSWAALPDDHPRDAHPGWRAPGVPDAGGVENFHAANERHGVARAQYTTVEGFYKDTLPALGPEGAPTDIALAYVDCDLYSSTVSVLEFLRPRLKQGMIVAFDDYFCWSEAGPSGERVALREFLAENPEWHFSRYRNIHWSGLAFVVERADGTPDAAGHRPGSVRFTIRSDDGADVDFECADNWSSRWTSNDILTGRTYPWLPFVPDVRVILDAGANCGAATVYFAHRCPEARIHAFEPGSEQRAILDRNTADHPNVSVHPFGLYSEDRDRGALRGLGATPGSRRCSRNEQTVDDGRADRPALGGRLGRGAGHRPDRRAQGGRGGLRGRRAREPDRGPSHGEGPLRRIRLACGAARHRGAAPPDARAVLGQGAARPG